MLPVPSSPLPPSVTYAGAHVRSLMKEWAELTAPGSPFMRTLRLASSSFRSASSLLALALLSSLVPPRATPILHVLTFLQLAACMAHYACGRWTALKTGRRTVTLVALVLGYTLATLAVEHVVLLAYAPSPDVRLEVLLYALRYQGLHLLLNAASATPSTSPSSTPSPSPRAACMPPFSSSLVVSPLA